MCIRRILMSSYYLCFVHSLDSHNNLYKKKRNAANLHTRRGRLMEMLMQEASQYEVAF